jgi:hypothetical protein
MRDTARPPDVDLRSWLAGQVLGQLVTAGHDPAESAKLALAHADELCKLLSASRASHNAHAAQQDADRQEIDLDNIGV